MKDIIYLIIILILISVIVMSFVTKPSISSNSSLKPVIDTLIRQCARWAIAAQQDKNVIIAVLHANYAAGYLWALRDIASDVEIQNLSGVDIIKFRDEITKIQDTATLKLNAACPKFSVSNTYLMQIAGGS